MTIPVLETERLRLRGHRVDDLDDCFAMWSAPEVTRYIGGKPSTRQQTWSRLVGYAGQWSLMGFGYWVIENRSTHRFLGELGFADFQREIAASMRGVPELGFALAPDARGKGYASEAVHAALAWGDEHLASDRTVCLIDEDNAASIRVVQKAGYAIFERAVFNNQPTLYLERMRP
jgi:RimJ/RimL family protein N-acetyltransferase